MSASAKVSIEELCQYLDEELTADDRRRIEALLSTDEESRNLLEELEYGSALARAGYSDFQPQPPQGARRMIENYAKAPADKARASRWVPLALAASLALLVTGVPVSYWLGLQQSQVELAELNDSRERARAEIDRAIDMALETLVSGQALPWQAEEGAGRGTVMPVRTFENHDGRWCREFTLEGEAADETVNRRAIACRASEMDWQVMLEIYQEVQGPSL